jgi:tetratricopeptide (TPR) repeat protein
MLTDHIHKLVPFALIFLVPYVTYSQMTVGDELRAEDLNQQANILIKNTALNEAIELLERAIVLRPDYPSPYFNIGTAYLLLKQPERRGSPSHPPLPRAIIRWA